MQHHDFDHNGKADSRDYYIMNEVINSSDDSQKTSTSYSSSSSMDSSTVWLLVAMFYFSTWIKGTLGFGFIASTLGLISGGYLFLRLLGWAYS